MPQKIVKVRQYIDPSELVGASFSQRRWMVKQPQHVDTEEMPEFLKWALEWNFMAPMIFDDHVHPSHSKLDYAVVAVQQWRSCVGRYGVPASSSDESDGSGESARDAAEDLDDHRVNDEGHDDEDKEWNAWLHWCEAHVTEQNVQTWWEESTEGIPRESCDGSQPQQNVCKQYGTKRKASIEPGLPQGSSRAESAGAWAPEVIGLSSSRLASHLASAQGDPA